MKAHDKTTTGETPRKHSRRVAHLISSTMPRDCCPFQSPFRGRFATTPASPTDARCRLHFLQCHIHHITLWCRNPPLPYCTSQAGDITAPSLRNRTALHALVRNHQQMRSSKVYSPWRSMTPKPTRRAEKGKYHTKNIFSAAFYG